MGLRLTPEISKGGALTFFKYCTLFPTLFIDKPNQPNWRYISVVNSDVEHEMIKQEVIKYKVSEKLDLL